MNKRATKTESIDAARVIYDTFGHLEMELNTPVSGYIIAGFEEGGFDYVILKDDFKNQESPGFYTDMNDFVSEYQSQMCRHQNKRPDMSVQRFDGQVTLTPNDEDGCAQYVFEGSWTDLTHLITASQAAE